MKSLRRARQWAEPTDLNTGGHTDGRTDGRTGGRADGHQRTLSQ